MRRDVRAVGSAQRFILVVDDEEPVRRLVVEILEDAGYRVAEADRVSTALPYLDDPALDLVVSDIRMPGTPGLTLLAAARERRPDLPLILMTGAAGPATRDRVTAEGVALLDKPFTFAELEAAVATALAR
jgi:DNA-binding NtrC family response regulator